MKKFSDENPNRDKSTQQLETEAKAAINKTIKAYQGVALIHVNREIRKAFPFGPNAGEREKKIWQKMCFDAEKEISKWPAPPLAMALIATVIFSCAPVMAQGVNIGGQTTFTPSLPSDYIVDENGQALVLEPLAKKVAAPPAERAPVTKLAPVTNPAYPKKIPFSVKHPKWHKTGRYFRKTCQVGYPLVQFFGACAQVVTSIR